MIAQLKGTLIAISPTSITLDVHDVGYEVFVADQWKTRAMTGSVYTLQIVTVVKQDAIELYGFSTNQEKYLFSLLLAVPGIGPKTALTIVGYGVEQIQTAITTANVDFFSTIPRIGKKNAQKIIIELKSKLGSVENLDLSNSENGKTKEVSDALISMGFSKHEIREVLTHHIDHQQSVEESLKQALRLLGKKK